MKNKLLKFWPLLIIFLLVAAFAYPYWAKGLIPFPSSYLVSFFPPWQHHYGMPVKNGAMPDVVTQMYPWKHMVINLWQNRQVPLWNPYNFSGSPLLANYQSAVFHPANLLFFVLPEIGAWSLMILLQPLLAGFFTYLFCRQLKLSQAAALLSSVSFMFCGFMTVWLAYGTLSFALLWLPLALYGVEKSFAKISPLSLILISFSLLASFFSGHFQTSLYVFSAVFAFLVFKFWMTRDRKAFVFCLLFLVLGITLASVQLLPTLELYQLSVRSNLLNISEVIPWRYLPTLVAPDFYGNPVTRNDWFGHYAEWSGFTGVLPFLLAAYVVFKKRRGLILFFGLLALTSFLLSRPTPILDLVIKLKIPVLSSSAAARINGLLSFSVAILAGFGFDQLRDDLAKKKLKEIIIVLSGATIFFILIWALLLFGRPFASDRIFIAKRNFILPTVMLGVLFGLVVINWLVPKIFRRKKEIARYLIPLALSLVLLLTTVDVFRFASKWMPFDSKEYVYPSVPVLEFLTKITDPDRLFGFFGMETQNYYRIPGFQGYDPLYIQRYGEFLMAADDGRIKPPSMRGVELGRRAKYTLPVLNLLGGRYLLHALADGKKSWVFPFWDYPEQFELIYQDGTYQIYENLGAFPRAFLAYDYQVIKASQAIINRMFDSQTDLKKTLILEEDPGLRREEIQAEPGQAEITNYSHNQIEIVTQTATSALLFLSDNYYPGWRVFIDDQEAKIYRADYSFRAVPVPSGKHQIIFVYKPQSFRLGLLASGLSLILLAPFSVLALRVKR